MKKSPVPRHAVSFGSKTIPFDLNRRNVKRLTINVYPDTRVEVIAPSDKPMEEIMARVRKRAPWIAKQIEHFEQYHPLPLAKRYVSGETHHYLGRQYRLKVVQDKAEFVKLIGRYIHVHTRDRDNIRIIQGLLDEWYLSHAKGIFSKRLERCLKMSQTLDVDPQLIIIRHMKRRWGSCTKAGNIVLNPELVKTPLYCIEYVIMHELCHLRIPKHNQNFYRLLSRYMPDWERRKERLDSFIL